MSADALELQRSSRDRWYVTNGATALGPLNFDRITRDIELGKIPLDSYLRNEAWTVWRPLREFTEVTGDRETPVPSQAARLPVASTDDVDEATPVRPALPDDVHPTDSLAGASDLHEALLLMLSAIVQKTRAEGALLLEVGDEGALALCAHGPNQLDVLGSSVRHVDPAIVAAAGGNVVLAEPTPGPAGQAIAARMGKLGVHGVSVCMVPIRPRGRLLATLELGRTERWRTREVDQIEKYVETLVQRIESEDW